MTHEKWKHRIRGAVYNLLDNPEPTIGDVADEVWNFSEQYAREKQLEVLERIEKVSVPSDKSEWYVEELSKEIESIRAEIEALTKGEDE